MFLELNRASLEAQNKIKTETISFLPPRRSLVLTESKQELFSLAVALVNAAERTRRFFTAFSHQLHVLVGADEPGTGGRQRFQHVNEENPRKRCFIPLQIGLVVDLGKHQRKGER